ncbi:uncharacterized protein DNG_09198 [Cephalotrichum gorgonifer]|uniref:Uncharacterized protein n=1 Tax=Cephalotrichum gorgonifer TaxID=2041049 RepID=A0AAE8SZ72_9PEZI|nr:uncharacterized protein DNG_09198 [Cephalotrichum gorgonifer]
MADDVGWSISASLFIVGFSYSSALNESYWDVPPTVEVDECGSRLISPGYVLWLVFVPAVACASQLQGSVYLNGRSTLYRLSPGIGIADALATLGLVAKALWNGYPWKTAVTAAFIAREGIGRSNAWWRERQKGDRESLLSEAVEGENSDLVDSPTADIAPTRSPSPEVPIEGFDEDGAQSPTTQNSGQLSIERAIGGLLVLTTLIKTSIILAGSGVSNTPVLIACLVAISYAASFVLFEVLTWSLSIPTSSYSMADMPRRNLLELLRIVDPGDLQIPCAAARKHENTKRQDLVLELGIISHTSQGSERAQSTTSTRSSITRTMMAVLFAGISIVLTSLSWLVLIYYIWELSRVVVETTAVIVVLGVGIHLAAEAWGSRITEPRPGGYAKALCGWLRGHTTPVNIISLVWIINIGAYIILAIPGQSAIELRTPMWLDWLG